MAKREGGLRVPVVAIAFGSGWPTGGSAATATPGPGTPTPTTGTDVLQRPPCSPAFAAVMGFVTSAERSHDPATAPGFRCRHRPSARQVQEPGLAPHHVGFRIAFDVPARSATRRP